MRRKRFGIVALVLALVLALLPARHTARATTYTVINTNDSGSGSLRQAIIDANNNPGPDTINFNISGCGGVCTIQPTSTLPTLSGGSTTIDGYTQPGAAEATDGTPATLLIEIDGANAGNSDGFSITSADNVIRGLMINRFSRYGVYISGSGTTGNTVSGNYIGTDASGTADLGNTYAGVYISGGAQNNTVGGDTPGERNIISGNWFAGVHIDGNYGSTTDNNVWGNYIGTDASGTADLGNFLYGVYISGGAQNNTVGPDNVIAHHSYYGVYVRWRTSTGNTITQNSIFSNGLGINLVDGANGDIAAPVIVATTAGSVNVVGTACPNCTVEVFENSDTDGEGETYVGNTTANASGAFTVTVSSLGKPYLTATATDVISGTSEFSAVFTMVTGGNVYTVTNTNDSGPGSLRQAIIDDNNNPGPDTINFNISGCGTVCTIQPTSALPTLTDDGTTIDGYTQPGAAPATGGTPATLLIEIDGTNAGNSDGFSITSAGNEIKGLVINRFSRDGVRISGSDATGNTVSGNYIGTDVNGTADLGNNSSGVRITNGAQNNAIGGDTPSERNVISGNWVGVSIYGNGTTGNTVSGNYIGTSASGTADLGNAWHGVYIYDDAQNNTVGPDNVIAYNGWDGVEVNGSNTTGNTVTQNSIFSNDMGIDLKFGANGGIAAPVIVTATLGSVNVVGTACPNCTVEVFENSDTDGEGEIYVGHTTATASGAFTVTVSSLSKPYLTATATDVISGTSEFSAVFTATVTGGGNIYLPIILKNY